jgi:hypothetical protein
MTKLEAIEREIEQLSERDLAKLREWLAEYDWKVWDRQLERDVAAGKLDAMAAEVIAEDERGETEPL